MVRLALIGCAEKAARYARLVPRLRGGQITAVVDAETKTAGMTAVALGARLWTDSLHTLLSQLRTEFDAIVLCGASRFHEGLCQRAAAAGKHILIENPMAQSSAAAKEIIAACASAGVRLMIGQSFRFLPAVQTVKDSLDRGQLGKPGLLRIHRWEPPNVSDQQDLLQELTREIDLAGWLFGQHPTNIFATGRTDYVQLHLGFTDGGMALIDFARTLPPGDGYFSLSLIGSAGAAYADDHHNMQLLLGRGHPEARLTGQGDGHLLAELQAFITAIEQNREPPITGADGLRAIVVAETAAAALSNSGAGN